MQNFKTKSVVIESNGFSNNLKLSYTNVSTSDKANTYQVNSTYDNQNLCFEISIPKNGLATLNIKSNGKSSDNFLHLLAKVYKQKIDTSVKFVDTITVDCMNLGDYVDSLNKQSNGSYVTKAQYKLFFQGKNEDDYAELYLNINDAEHEIEFDEKDEEYRPIIVKLLTKKAAANKSIYTSRADTAQHQQ